jgi:hypothetical protein
MHGPAALSVRDPGKCGCLAPSRWQCLACARGAGALTAFLACSRRCLDRHQRRSHGEHASPRPEVVSLEALREGNRGREQNWSLYEGHRQRLTRLLGAVQRADGLCVLGAGNCDDLDLPRLVLAFDEVHLVDLDTEALERGVARLPPAVRRRIVLHGGVELTGLLGSVEVWAEEFPSECGFRAREDEAVRAITRGLGRTFDVVLSDCVLSQLCVPFFRLLAARMSEWSALMRAVARVHAGTMAALLRGGGTGVLVGDVPYTLGPPAGEPAPPRWEELGAEVTSRLREGVSLLRRPAYLVELIAATPALGAAQLTEPWLWSQEEALMLAYAVLFRRDEREVRA